MVLLQMLINNIFDMFIHCITNIFGISWAFGNYINNIIDLLILILKPFGRDLNKVLKVPGAGLFIDVSQCL